MTEPTINRDMLNVILAAHRGEGGQLVFLETDNGSFLAINHGVDDKGLNLETTVIARIVDEAA